MGSRKSLWSMAEEDAIKLRKEAKKTRNYHKAALLLLASSALEDLSYELARGAVSADTVARLESLERLFRLYGLPSSVLAKYRKLAIRYIAVYSIYSVVDEAAEELIGLP